MHSMVQSMTGGTGRVEVIALAATDEGDVGSQYSAPPSSDNQRTISTHQTVDGGAVNGIR